MKHTVGEQMQHMFVPLYVDGMTCIVPSLKAADDVEAVCNLIDPFAFAFVTPLRTDHHR
jgi:hypothetical protein